MMFYAMLCHAMLCYIYMLPLRGVSVFLARCDLYAMICYAVPCYLLPWAPHSAGHRFLWQVLPCSAMLCATHQQAPYLEGGPVLCEAVIWYAVLFYATPSHGICSSPCL